MARYNIKKNNNININYLSKDFISLKRDLIEYAKSYFPDTYQDFNETSPGMMLMEMSAYVGDVLSFYIDQQFKEMILPLSEERRNVMNLSNLLGYKVKPIVPAITTIKFTQTVPDDGTSDINRQPDYNKLMSFDKGISIQSLDNSDVVFETLDYLDFSITGSVDTLPQVDGTDSNGLANLWKVERSVLAVSGKTKTIEYSIGSPKQFLKLTLPDNNVINIESIIDSNNNTWYEVDYLAQDKIYTETKNNDPNVVGEDDTNIPVQYTLNEPESVAKRFITQTNTDNTTSIIFGNGLLRSKNNEQAVTNFYTEHQDINALIQGSLPTSIDPIDSMFGDASTSNQSLGESPSNTTLTVKYRVGGGISSNVSANDLENIMNASSKVQNNNTTRLSTLIATNIYPARGGLDEESIEVIKEKAKSNFASQNRAVTSEDYEARIKSMPSRFGNIAKVFVERKGIGESQIFNAFDIDGNTFAGGDEDAQAFQDLFAAFWEVGEGAPVDFTENTQRQDVMENIRSFISNLSGYQDSDAWTWKNLNVYLLSYDHNKNLVKTTSPIINNLKAYLKRYKILSDDVDVVNGRVINFGVFFRIETYQYANKSEVKLKCINEIIKYFEPDKMKFNQVIHTSDLENILYGIDGVKVIKQLILTQSGELLGLTRHLYAYENDDIDSETPTIQEGVPGDGIGGQSSETYGYNYQNWFNDFYTSDGYSSGNINYGNGVIIPSVEPAVFELKNPNDNVKGIVE